MNEVNCDDNFVMFCLQIEHLCELLASRRIPGEHSKAKSGCYVQQSQIVQQGMGKNFN